MTSPAAPSSPKDDLFILAIQHAVRQALRKAMRRVAVALLIGILAFAGLGYLAWQSNNEAAQLKRASIVNCDNNNAFRKASQQILDHILDATIAGAKPSPAAIAFVANQEAYIARKYAPKNCRAIYAGASSNAASTSPPSAKFASLYHEDAVLQGWGGDCLSFVGSPAAGASLNYVDCSVARWWQYYPATGQLRPNADLNLAAGDLGRAALTDASNTGESTLNVKDWVTGIHGWQFAVYYFAGHSNSDMYVATPGQVVSLNSNAGDGARWVLLTPGTGVAKTGKSTV